jgi:hypothetical protein
MILGNFDDRHRGLFDVPGIAGLNASSESVDDGGCHWCWFRMPTIHLLRFSNYAKGTYRV